MYSRIASEDVVYSVMLMLGSTRARQVESREGDLRATAKETERKGTKTRWTFYLYSRRPVRRGNRGKVGSYAITEVTLETESEK